jgi:hypothetical protein
MWPMAALAMLTRSAAAEDCSPPYVLDAAGLKHFKAACFASAAPAPPSPGPTTAAPTPPSSTFAVALAVARAARDASLRLTPPVYRGDGSEQSFRVYKATKLEPWIARARADVADLERKYAMAERLAPSAIDRVTTMSERAHAVLVFTERAYAAAGAAMPSAWHDDPWLSSAYTTGVDDAFAAERERAQATLSRCVVVARSAGVTGRAAERCQELEGRSFAALSVAP